MKPIKHILFDEEKKIVENHFLHNKNNSKQDFKKFSEDTIARYIGKPFSLKDKEQRNNIEHSIELIWDKETNTTAMMHLFGHHKFSLSNTKLKHLSTFNGDVNAVDNENKTALMYLAHHSQNDYAFISLIKSNPDGWDLNAVDIHNKTFHLYFFDNYNKKTFDPRSQKSRYGDEFMPVLRRIDNFTEVLHHWLDTACPKTDENVLFVADKSFLVAEAIKDLAENSDFKKNYNNSSELLDVAKRIESIAQALQLNTTLKVNEQKKPKMKI